MATAVMTSLRTKFLGKAEARVLFVGLDGGGKSTILYRLKNGTVNESEIIRAPRTAHPDAPLDGPSPEHGRARGERRGG